MLQRRWRSAVSKDGHRDNCASLRPPHYYLPSLTIQLHYTMADVDEVARTLDEVVITATENEGEYRAILLSVSL